MAEIDLSSMSKEDAVKIIEAAKKVLVKGVRSGEARVKPAEIVPTTPEYAHMSKADVVEAEKKRKEKNLKMKEYSKKLDEEKGEEKPSEEEEPKAVAPLKKEPKAEPKKKGRPKK